MIFNVYIYNQSLNIYKGIRINYYIFLDITIIYSKMLNFFQKTSKTFVFQDHYI